MTQAPKRLVRTTVLSGLTGVALICSTGLPAFAADPATTPNNDSNSSVAAPADKIKGDLANIKGQVSVYVQLNGQGAFAATQPDSVKDNRSKPVDAAASVQKIRKDIEATAQSVTKDAAAKQLYTTTNSLPGVAIVGDADAIRDLSKRSDVAKITPIVPKTVPENKSTDIDTRALNTWAQTGQTGKGVKIAVIDTGLDYTHTDFGGPGTAAAYAKAKASPEILPGTYDPQKFLGGYDLAGDAYNADPSMPSYNPVPTPDNNPLDCASAGHGSHVAGTAAGYGVREDGSTFTAGRNGDPKYSELTEAQVNGMRIGPGSAPEAQLLSFRVFGCSGSTDLVIEALDRALDPNQDGKFDDRADIVNMSLGSKYAPVDDPENDVINSMTKNGVLSVISSGNDGDVYDIGGAPGNAKTSLTVANSIGSAVALDRVEVLAPTVGTAAGQYSGFDPNTVTGDKLTGTVVMGPAGSNADGCAAFSAEDSARIKGSWVWLSWDDNNATRKCGSAVRFNNAEKAGATGVVLDSTLDVFTAGIAGNATIAGVQFTKSFSQQLRPAAQAGNLKLQLKGEYRGTANGVSNQLDTLNPGSSRGVHGSNGIVKPDVAAPGTLIGSAGVASGSNANVKTGTSMAAPHVAGIAALVMGSTKLPALQVKSIVMNTANHDVFRDQKVYGPNRVGSGRVDALDATSTDAFAFASDDPELTSVNFGVLEVADKPVNIKKSVTVQSFGKAGRDYAVKYLPATTVPGVEYQVSPQVKVGPGGTAKVEVTLKITDPTALRKSLDPTMDATQLGTPRQFIAEASGRLELSSAGAPSLRVPIYAAPKPTSAMTAGKSLTFPNDKAGSIKVPLSGRALAQGGLGSSGYNSLLAPFELQSSSPRIDKLDETAGPGSKENSAVRAMDLQNVGISSTIPALAATGGNIQQGDIGFGISTWGNWAALTPAYRPYVYIDTDNDGKDDFRLSLGFATGLDLPLVTLNKINADGSLTVVGSPRPLNGLNGGLDSNTMDTNVMVLPVQAAALGIDASKASPFTYRVVTYSNYKAKDGFLVPVDQTEPKKYDPVNPALWFEDGTASQLFFDKPDAGLNVHQGPGAASAKALFLHLQNATGDLSAKGDGGKRAEVLPVSVTPTKLALTLPWTFAGGFTVATGSGFTPDSAVTVKLAEKTVSTVKADKNGKIFAFVWIPFNTTAGSYKVTATDAVGASSTANLSVFSLWPKW
ncbi:MAG: S8 family serine peptidase [Renibacterium salmoninarum]|nr:S8 family serine peptidase [Renibacterium salmoninarum]